MMSFSSGLYSVCLYLSTDKSSICLNLSDISIHDDQDTTIPETDNLLHDYRFFENEKLFTRVDTTPERTQTLPFLKNFKNPCWRELYKGNNPVTRCLPYFYQIGPPKCGTTDLFQRLIQHPQISDRIRKEIRWIDFRRFIGKEKQNLSVYLQQFYYAVHDDIWPQEKHGFHDVIFGDFSPDTIWNNLYYWSNNSTIFKSNAEVIHHLNPKTKILVSLRNPVNRTYSDYKHVTRNASARSFHEHVKRAIQEFNRACRNTVNLRRCIDLFPNAQLVYNFITNIHDQRTIYKVTRKFAGVGTVNTK
ncbi:Carbohydrate sulfotransferase 15 [Mactra antiquata]